MLSAQNANNVNRPHDKKRVHMGNINAYLSKFALVSEKA